MWKLLSAELLYNWFVLLGGMVLAPAIALVSGNESPFFMLFIIILPLTQGMLAIRSKEKRDRLHLMLPVSPAQVAAVRVLLVIVALLLWGAACLAVVWMLGVAGWEALRSFGVLAGIVLTAFSGAFILNDLVLVSVSRARLALLLAALAMLGTVLLSLGLWALYSQGNGAEFIDVPAIEDFLAAHNPFAGLGGNLLFLACSLLLSAASVATFTRRKTYILQ